MVDEYGFDEGEAAFFWRAVNGDFDNVAWCEACKVFSVDWVNEDGYWSDDYNARDFVDSFYSNGDVVALRGAPSPDHLVPMTHEQYLWVLSMLFDEKLPELHSLYVDMAHDSWDDGELSGMDSLFDEKEDVDA